MASKVPHDDEDDDDAVSVSLWPAQAGECKQEAVLMKIAVLKGSASGLTSRWVNACMVFNTPTRNMQLFFFVCFVFSGIPHNSRKILIKKGG